MKKKFAIIGTGVVGTALAVRLADAGLECVGVHTRSQLSYDRFSQYLPHKFRELSEISTQAELIFITTQDKGIEAVAERLTKENARRPGQIWIHCSGSLRSESMRKDPSLPVNYLSIHPLQAFADIDNALNQIEGTHFGVEGDTPECEEIGKGLVKVLGGIPHSIDPEKKTLYHAGAVVASNYLVSLAFLAVKLFGQAGIHQQDALESLLPLMQGSYNNIATVGLPCALTGPIARGDVAVVAKHLQEMPPELQETYKGLGKLALELSQKRKMSNCTNADIEDFEKLEKILT